MAQMEPLRVEIVGLEELRAVVLEIAKAARDMRVAADAVNSAARHGRRGAADGPTRRLCDPEA